MGWYTAQCKMLPFCAKAIVKSHAISKLAHLKKKHIVHLATFWFSTFVMHFRITRCVVGHEVLKNKWYIVIKAYKFSVLEILRDFLYIPRYPYI